MVSYEWKHHIICHPNEYVFKGGAIKKKGGAIIH